MNKVKTSEVIQKVAVDLFRRFGFEKTSMEEIARKAHKAKRSLYNHFNSKEEIFSELVRQEMDVIRERLDAVVSDGKQFVLTRLRQYLLLRMELLAEAGTLLVAMRGGMLDTSDYRFGEVKQSVDGFAQWEHEVFQRVWYAKPTQDTPEVVEQQATAFADMLQVVLNGLSHSFFVENKYEQYRSSYEMLVNLIVNSIFETFQHQALHTEDPNALLQQD